MCKRARKNAELEQNAKVQKKVLGQNSFEMSQTRHRKVGTFCSLASNNQPDRALPKVLEKMLEMSEFVQKYYRKRIWGTLQVRGYGQPNTQHPH